METNFSQIQFNIFLTMLKEYVLEKDEDLVRLQQGFVPLLANSHSSDMHKELIDYSKQVVSQIQTFYMETKDFFDDVKMDEAFNFFQKCFNIAEQIIKYLTEALRDRINKAIDNATRHAPSKKHRTTVTTTTNEQQQVSPPKLDKKAIITNREDLKRVTQVISRDLQSIDYYLNMLSGDDFKPLTDTKCQFEKLMHHRRSIENIKPSQASKEIMETANMIENAAENAQKAFHESYLMNYLQFKSFFANTQESDAMVSSFKKDMDTLTKDKFIQAISRNADRIFNNEKDYIRLHQVNEGTQTDEVKYKVHEKMQNLLMVEKRNNQKLNSQIQSLKKNQSNVGVDKGQLQKKLEREVQIKKQYENKYLILENLYNEKCYELTKNQSQFGSHLFKTEVPQKLHRASVGSQTLSEFKRNYNHTTVQCQTDLDFYYYYENSHIEELHNKINQLEKIVNHKDYVLKEMEAVKTFRDNFKSKKQIFSCVLLPKRTLPEAKSLHYLREEEEVSICRDKEQAIMNSIEGGSSTKRLVTFREADGENNKKEDSQGRGFSMKKRVKKNRNEAKNQTFFAFNDKISNPDEHDEFISQKSQHCLNLHQISLKSILKMGYANHYKMNSGTQTDLMKPDAVIQSAHMPPSEKVNERVESREKNSSREHQKSHRIRQSFASTVKISKDVRMSEVDQARKSNFMNQKVMMTKTDAFNHSLPPVNRNSQALSPLVKKDKMKLPMKTGRFNQSRVHTTGNEIVHVNNTLNLNLNFDLTTLSKAKPKLQKQNRKVVQRHVDNSKMLKMKK